MRGLIIGAMDGLSGGIAGKQLAQSPVGNAILQSLTQASLGVTGEASAQVATKGRITNLSDVIIEGLAEFATAPVEAVAIGQRSLFKSVRSAANSGAAADIVDQVSEQAQASKMRERSPEAFKEALDVAGRGDDLLYVPAHELREYFQAKDLTLDDEALTAWGIDQNTFEEMELAGGRVGIPVSNLSAYLVGTDAESWIRENASIDPDGMSLSDAAAFNEAVNDDLARSYERYNAEVQAEEAARSNDEQVCDDLYSQLRSAGRTTDVASNEARVMAAFFRTMSQRVGETSLDLAQRFGLSIKGPDAPGVPRRRNQLDIMLNDLRSGRKEKAGRSLTQFVIDEGGVRDTGGDIAELQGPKGLVAESRDDIQARKAQGSLAGMPSGGKGQELDELGRRAVEAGYSPELIGEVQGLNDGEAADLGAALLEALREESSGRIRYADGETLNADRQALIGELERRGFDVGELSNDQIAEALENDPDGVAYNQDAVPPGAVKMWRHGLQRLLSGAASTLDMLSMGKPGAVLRAIGLSNAPLTMRGGKLRKVMQEHPEVTPQIADCLVQGINDPEFVLKSATESDSIVVVPVQLDDGRVFVVPIRKDVKDDEGRKINLITSAYIKDDAQWIEREISAGRLIYSREGKSAAVRANRSGSNSQHVHPNPAGRNLPRKQKILSRADVFKGKEFKQQKRGSITFPLSGVRDGGAIVSLFETADLSTMMHESAHYFLEVMQVLSSDPNAPQEILDDMAIVREYLGMEEGQSQPTVEQHETFARSFEAYLMEGKAPSLELADVFSRVRAWLVRIYKNLAGLNVPINDEIRGVFDRILASDAEIAEVQAEMSAGPLFRDKPAGMSDTDWKTYQRLARRSQEKSESNLIDKTLDRVRREKQRWWKDERKQVRSEVEAVINTEPRYRLIEAMANGTRFLPDGTADVPDVRIDRKHLVDKFGDGVLAELSRNKLGGKRAIYCDEGISPEEAANMFGFQSAGDMVEVLQNTPKRITAIESETDRIMLDRYGDPFTDGSIEQEAMDAIHNSQQAQKNVAEARQMATRLGRDTRGMTSRLYKQRAAAMLGRMNTREATGSARFLASERRAGKEAERAFAKVARGDDKALAAALQAKEQQILNAALYDLSREAEAEVAKARERMRSYTKASVREKLSGGYIEL